MNVYANQHAYDLAKRGLDASNVHLSVFLQSFSSLQPRWRAWSLCTPVLLVRKKCESACIDAACMKRKCCQHRACCVSGSNSTLVLFVVQMCCNSCCRRSMFLYNMYNLNGFSRCYNYAALLFSIICCPCTLGVLLALSAQCFSVCEYD